MLGCPLEGVAADSVLDAGPALRETVEKYLGDPAFSNLPRKYKTSISGCARHCTNHEINDCAFVGVIGPDGDARLRPLGRRRPVDQPALRRAARRVRPAGRGQRGVGRRHVDLPRLRLPAAAQPRPAEVPDGRLGPGEVPRGARDRVPAAARCPTARRPSISPTPPRPHRRRGAARRPARDRRHHEVRPHVGHRTARARRRSPTGTRTAGCGSPPSRASSCSTSRRSAEDAVVDELDALGLTVRPVGVPARHDRLHRHRVLQARARRDQGAGRDDPRGARAAAARLRHPDHDQRQRLPELVRALPGRRHRLQGHGRRRRPTATSRPSRCTSADRWARRRNSGASSAV